MPEPSASLFRAGAAALAFLVMSPVRAEDPAVLPGDNIWNVPVDTLPVDSNSAAYVNSIGLSGRLHPDFGTFWEDAPIGIPYVFVPGTQPKLPVDFDYAGESDAGPYPIPDDPPIEGGTNSTGDRHILIIDRDNWILYELYYAWPPGTPPASPTRWYAGSGAIFDLKSNALRPDGWTSADAAGLPIFPGLVRYDEVMVWSNIDHAIRFTAPQTREAYVWPARHHASSLTNSCYPPMGQRFRLKRDFDIGGFSGPNQVILRALKKYGMILADNGSAWYISGAHDPRWDDDLLGDLGQVRGSNFEAVSVSPLMIRADEGLTYPVLSATSTASGLEISWLTSATGYVLLASSDLHSTSAWAAVTNAVTTNSGFSGVALPPDAARRCFRLGR